MATKFSTASFVQALKSGGLREPLVLHGMVKAGESDKEVLFSPGGDCLNWLPIPLDMIESEDGIEFLRTVPCKDHHHPLVRLKFKDMPTESKESALLVALLRHAASTAAPQPQAKFAAAPCGPQPRSRSRGSSRFNRAEAESGDWYCYVRVHCGNGEFGSGEGTDPYQDATALSRAYDDARYFCYNRGGVLSFGPSDCER